MRTTPDIWIPPSGQVVPAGPIHTGHTISQSFVAKRDGLCAVEFLGATYGTPIPSGTIKVTVARSEPRDPGTIAVRQIDARSVADNHYVRIEFPPVRDSAARHFVISIEPQDLPPAAMFTVWLTQKDVYPGGTGFIDAIATPGDLVMTTSHQSSVLETATAYLTVFSVSILIGVYFVVIGLAALLAFNVEAISLAFVAPAAGIALVGAVAVVSVLTRRLHSINLVGALLLACFTAVILFRNREKLLRLQIPRSTVFFYLALIAVSCCITSQPQTIPRSDLPYGPLRSFVPCIPPTA